MNWKTLIFSMGFLCLFTSMMTAQPIEEEYYSESFVSDKVIDGIYEESLISSTPPLQYDHIREADVFWEKRIWRVIDVREKMNQAFIYPELPFINILLEAAQQSDITIYSAIDDKFSTPLNENEAKTMGVSIDTSVIYDPVTFQPKTVITKNILNWEDIKRFRIKEVWFFDEETSTMQVRILGIAPLREVYDNQGNFKYEQPMFWAYYPELRKVLASKEVFNPLNDAGRMSWEDIIEMRYFSSYIYKESNIHDRRLQDYLSGVDILLEADKIKNELLNFEHDLWSY
jgi:gliding motility associated protien GldN